MKDHVESCLNCDTPLGGAWCTRCGQINRRERLDPSDLAHDAFDQLVGVDTKIGRTLVDFTRNPGAAGLAYVRGHRARYVNPIKYMILALALYFLTLKAFGLKATELGLQAPPAQSSDPIAMEVDQALKGVVEESLRLIIFAVPPVFAWVTGFFLGRRHFRRTKDAGLLAWASDMLEAPRRFNFAESCSLWLHVFAHVTLLATLPALCLAALGFRSAGLWALIPAMAYYIWAARGFYGRGWLYSGLIVFSAYVAYQAILLLTLALSALVAFAISG